MDAASATTFGMELVVFSGLGVAIVVVPLLLLLLLVLVLVLLLLNRGLVLALLLEVLLVLLLEPKKSSELLRIPVFFLARSRTDLTRLLTP